MSNNPLSNYFRRPALYLKLPSKGIGYTEGSLIMPDNEELPIYPMTAVDEITARTPDALFNGVAVVELIRSCVPNIKDPWSMPQIDLDPILLAIKIATNGSTMEIESICQNCGETSKYDINLTGLLNSFNPKEYDNLYTVTDEIQIKFKTINYKQINNTSQKQFEVQRALQIINDTEDVKEKELRTTELIKEMNSMALELILDMIEYVKTPNATVFERGYIKEFLLNIPKQLFDNIRDYTIELKKSIEVQPLDFKCVHCSHEYKQPLDLNISDFFG
jgi:hypothetical protein